MLRSASNLNLALGCWALIVLTAGAQTDQSAAPTIPEVKPSPSPADFQRKTEIPARAVTQQPAQAPIAGATSTAKPVSASRKAGSRVSPAVLEETLPLGVFEEEATLDLETAIQCYQATIEGFDAQRPEVAQAVFRLAECCRKSGRKEEAAVQYARVLREFSDQIQLVELSQRHLSGNALRPGVSLTIARYGPSPASNSSASSKEDLAARKSLLDQQIQSFEKQVKDAEKQLELGATTQQAVLILKRQWYALKRDRASISSKNSDSLQIQLLKELIKLAEEHFSVVKKQSVAGVDAPALPIEQDLVKLRSELARYQKRSSRSSPVRAVLNANSFNLASGLSSTQENPGVSSFGSSRSRFMNGSVSPLVYNGTELKGQSVDEAVSEHERLRLHARLVQSKKDADKARREWLNVETALKSVRDLSAEALPEAAIENSRYQRLKEAYEEAVLKQSAAAPAEPQFAKAVEEARRKVITWVEKVFIPQQRTAVKFAERQYLQLSNEVRQIEREIQEMINKATALVPARGSGEQLDKQRKQSRP